MSSAFQGQLVFSNAYAISVEFTSMLNNECWLLTTVYASCTPAGKEFLDWFREIPLSQQAHDQMLQLQVMLEQVELSDLPDRWTYIWNSNLYSVRKAYK